MDKKLCAKCADIYRAAGYDVKDVSPIDKDKCAECGKVHRMAGILRSLTPEKVDA